METKSLLIKGGDKRLICMKMLGLTVIYSTNQNVNNSAQGVYKDKTSS